MKLYLDNAQISSMLQIYFLGYISEIKQEGWLIQIWSFIGGYICEILHTSRE